MKFTHETFILLTIAVMLDFLTNSCTRPEPTVEQCKIVETKSIDSSGFSIFDDLNNSNTCISKNTGGKCIASATYSTCNTITRKQLDSLLNILEYNNHISHAILVNPLDKTQTVIACNKQGKALETFKVISDQNGNIDMITFTDKKHQIAYNVKSGITKNQLKKLRKDVKNFVESGQVFYYDEKELTTTDKLAKATTLQD